MLIPQSPGAINVATGPQNVTTRLFGWIGVAAQVDQEDVDQVYFQNYSNMSENKTSVFSGKEENNTIRFRGNGDPAPSKQLLFSTAQDNPNVSQSEDDDDDRLDEKIAELTKDLPQCSDHTTEALDSALSGFSAKWRNWIVRFILTFMMIGAFSGIVYLGPLALTLLVLAIQIKCFQEVIDIGYAVYRVHNLPWFRSLSWYLLWTSNYFFYGESQIQYFSVLLRKTEFLRFLVVHHRLISFTAYIGGFVWFVLSLKKKYYVRQFSLFAWTHVTLLLIVTVSYLIMSNIFEGMIWFLVPVCMIICNDIMAYVFGFFFGRTPLIKLSPKKTWEGFVGGAVSTILFGVALSYILIRYPTFVCPIHYDGADSFTHACRMSSTFRIQHYDIPSMLSGIFRLLHLPTKLKIYPFVFHAFAMSLFASLLGPFGGFCASGFKRAFKVKDFGAVIPGHGGLMDRFDCQLLMGVFVYVWIYTIPSADKIYQQIEFLGEGEQMEVLRLLCQKFVDVCSLGGGDTDPDGVVIG
uniref:Phosphatidate cytidylyltransferase n=1 Tax=Romanomermis culicivorax TaxID=13658 RepID=A0A915KE16_ROMCU